MQAFQNRPDVLPDPAPRLAGCSPTPGAPDTTMNNKQQVSGVLQLVKHFHTLCNFESHNTLGKAGSHDLHFTDEKTEVQRGGVIYQTTSLLSFHSASGRLQTVPTTSRKPSQAPPHSKLCALEGNDGSGLSPHPYSPSIEKPQLIAAGMKIITIIKAGNSLPTLCMRTRGIKKGQDLPSEHICDQVRSPPQSVASFVPLCPWLSALLDSKPLPEVHFWILLHWLGPTWSSQV